MKPFFEYESITDSDAQRLQESVAALRDAQDSLINASAEDRLSCAQRYLELHGEITDHVRDIKKEIYTVPAIVHVAGDIYEEEDNFGQTIYVQRCKKCGSELSISNREAAHHHYEQGQVIARSAQDKKLVGPGGRKRNIPSLYFIDDRELQPHEYECVSLRDIFEDLDISE